ncbi:nucleotide pyrophosphatase/phosphodiesterase family protein [Thermodesulfobacteriota bacterium]
MQPDQKWLVVQVAGLGYDFLAETMGAPAMAGLDFKPLAPLFPALTCPVQASFTTAAPPGAHGMVGNGFFDRQLNKAFFWEQSANLIAGERIWQKLRESGKKVAQLFWQQSLGPHADLLLSPAPIHKHHGGMIQDCFCLPRHLYADIVRHIGSRFPLGSYWGPFASKKSSVWIAQATRYVMEEHKPDLLLTYIPHLDYELQRSGPRSRQSAGALALVAKLIADLASAAKKQGYQLLIFGDYAVTDVSRTVFPNRVLYETGFLQCREVKGMLYPDVYTSRAFAMVDHQVAHVILQDKALAHEIAQIFSSVPGVGSVSDAAAQKKLGMAHRRSGDLLLAAEQGTWFAYPWWHEPARAPDYARHVDIHNKPGYDPCELFWDLLPFRVSLDTTRVKGSHGLASPKTTCAWAATADVPFSSGTITDLAHALREVLNQ